MRIRDAKEAAVAEEAEAKAAEGPGVCDGGPGTGAGTPTGRPQSTTGHHLRPGYKATNNRSAQTKAKEQGRRMKNRKGNVAHQLDFDTPLEYPWNNPDYMQMMITEYGGGCGVMQLMDDGVIPSAMLL